MTKEHCELEAQDSNGSLSTNPVENQTGLILPFVGRTSDLTRITEFAQTAIAARQLSLLWIEGEAGIGKSRLLEEALSRLDPNIVVIQTRFNPNSRTPLARSLYTALYSNNVSDPEPPTSLANQLPELLGKLRTKARLSPLLLVVEDVHLLDAKTMTELVTVLHGLEKESLGVICTARPGNETVYGAVLPFLIDTIQLTGLSTEDIQKIGEAWNYSLKNRENLVSFLHEHTQGLPLILQSVITDLLFSKEERKNNPVATVRRIAYDTKQSLTQGLTRGLSDANLAAAQLLATLGKNFSEHTAQYILENPKPIIDELCQRSVLTPSYREIEPLYGTPLMYPRYEFIHSLLHEYLLSKAPPPGKHSLDLVLSGAPLYSTVPFTYIADINIPSTDWEKTYQLLLDHCIKIVDSLANSPDWEIASVILSVAWKLFNNHEQDLPAAERRTVYFHLLRLRLQTLNAFPAHPSFINAADELLELTTDPETFQEAQQRLFALEYSLFRTDTGWTFRADEVFEETESLVTKFPQLLLDEHYLMLLGNIAGAMRASSPFKAIEGIRKRFTLIVAEAEENGNHEALRTAYTDIAPNFIPVFQTQEELADRKSLAERILQEYGKEVVQGRFATSWPRFLEMVGEPYRAKEVLEEWAPHPLSGYNLSREFALRLLEILVKGAIEPDLATVKMWCIVLLREFQQLQHLDENAGKASLAQTAIAAHVLICGIMRGEIDWASRTALELCDKSEMITHYMKFERAALSQDIPTLRQLVAANTVPDNFLPMVRAIIEPAAAGKEEALQTAHNILKAPILQRHDILSQRMMIALADATKSTEMLTELRPAIQDGLRNALHWLVERKLKLYALPTLTQAKSFFDTEEYAQYSAVFEGKELTAMDSPEPKAVKAAGKTSTISVSMLGEMSIHKAGKKPKKIRGSRMKRTLAVLTANALADQHLSLAHFRTVATESEDPEEGASYLRIIISRLRKELGKEAITTDGKNAPQLDIDLIHVDLIDAMRLVGECLHAIRSHHVRHAYNAMHNALDILLKGDPYPDLNDDFFKATRKELKNEIKHGIVLAHEALRKHGDEERAQKLLKQALMIFTNDEELTRQLESF